MEHSASARWREQLLRWTAPPPEDSDPAAPPTDGWRAHADRFRALNTSLRGREEPFVRFLQPWLPPSATVLDVGAGGGRYALPLAERGVRVTAVEPSEGMRGVLAEAASERGLNLTIVPQRWPPAPVEMEAADVVICANVAYDVADLAPFVQALDQTARRLVAVALTLTHPVGHTADLWQQFRGWTVPDGPTYLDVAAVVFETGIACNVTLLPTAPTLRFADWDAAVAFYRRRLGLRPDAVRDAALRDALASTVVAAADALVVQPHERQSAVIWWEKTK